MTESRLIISSVSSDQLLMSAWSALLRDLTLISDSMGENAVITQ